MVRNVCLCLFAVLVFAAGSLSGQTVDEVVQKNIDAHGGLAKMKEIQSVRMTGKMIMGQGMEAPVVYVKKRPNFLRVEIQVQGMTGVQAYDGETGWYVMPFQTGNKDPQKMTKEDLEDLTEQADFDGPLVDYKAKGNQVELVGKEDVEGTPAHKLKVTLKSGQVRYLYLDEETGLEIKATSMIKREGVERSMDSFFGDYKTVDGVVYPFSIEIKAPNQPGPQYTIEKVEHNVQLDDSIFKMPADAAEQTKPAEQ